MWTLAEALEKALLRSERITREEFEYELRLGPEDVDQNDARLGFEEKRQAAFIYQIAKGRLAASGRLDGGNGGSVAISADAWRRARIDWDGSALRYGRDDKRPDIVEIRLQPWLHLPETFEKMAGLTLQAAFHRFVLEDPEFNAAVDRASWASFHPSEPRNGDHDPYECVCDVVRDGLFSAGDHLWPAFLEERDLAVEWMTSQPRRFPADLPPAERRGKLNWLASESAADRAEFNIIREAERVVRDRVIRFLSFLRAGKLVATGLPKGHSVPVPIPAAHWRWDAVRIDFRQGELFIAGNKGSPALEYSGVALSLPETLKTSQRASEKTEKSQGGGEDLYEWGPVLKLADERYAALPLRPNGTRAGNGEKYAHLVRECFVSLGLKAPGDNGTIRKKLAILRPVEWAIETKSASVNRAK